MGIFDVESRSEGENLPSVSRSEKSSRYHFQVNLGGMLDILSNHLYKSPDVFIRELLQNGVDAITMRQKRQLVQCCINNRVICTCSLRQYSVVVSQQCHRIASFLRLVLTQISSTYYFKINATLY